MRKIITTSLTVMMGLSLLAQNAPDPAVVAKLRNAEATTSQVMDIAFYLTDVNGPRLTASPGFLSAANWAKDKLTGWGLTNATIEPWGEFGKGWQTERCYVAMTKPYYANLIAYPKAWTAGTGKKPVTGDIVLIKATDSATLVQQYTGKLKGKIIMTWVKDSLHPSFTPDGSRLEDSVLQKMAAAEMREPGGNGPFGSRTGRPSFTQAIAFTRTLNALIASEKPALTLSMAIRGTDGTVFVQSGGSYAKDAPEAGASVVLASDDYLRLQRLVSAGIPVELEADIKTKFLDKDLQGYNVIAEIPGTDPVLKNQVVMLGGHLDSWHSATGATDNAAGCAVMLEAVRLLKASGVQPRRTIRIALWGGEEQGLFGSRNYVKMHLGDPATMQLKPEAAKISAYYNLDNGTGKIRGIYLQGNSAARPVFTKWFEPFADMGAATVTINNTGSTDHVSFDAIGIPGFQFIQDGIEYGTRTHHSNMDTYDHLVPEDLKQAATIVAAFVYNTAQQEEMIPRKELPKPRAER